MFIFNISRSTFVAKSTSIFVKPTHQLELITHLECNISDTDCECQKREFPVSINTIKSYEFRFIRLIIELNLLQAGVAEVVYFIDKNASSDSSYTASQKLLSLARVKVSVHHLFESMVMHYLSPVCITWIVLGLATSTGTRKDHLGIQVIRLTMIRSYNLYKYFVDSHKIWQQ